MSPKASQKFVFSAERWVAILWSAASSGLPAACSQIGQVISSLRAPVSNMKSSWHSEQITGTSGAPLERAPPTALTLPVAFFCAADLAATDLFWADTDLFAADFLPPPSAAGSFPLFAMTGSRVCARARRAATAILRLRHQNFHHGF